MGKLGRSVTRNVEKRNSGLTEEDPLVSTYTLKRVVAPDKVKKAVVDIIIGMDDNEDTFVMMLYFLRIFDNPAILESDIRYLQTQESLSRRKREVAAQVKKWVLLLIGLAASAGFVTVLKFLGL